MLQDDRGHYRYSPYSNSIGSLQLTMIQHFFFYLQQWDHQVP
jgi:hypothetical protein